VEQFFQQVVAGLATGSIYASLALALVVIYRSTEVINFAQGEMAMFTTYIAWQLDAWGFSYWPMFFATLGIAFVGGLAIERTIIRPVEHASVLTIVIVTIGLLVVLNGLAGWIWSPELKAFPSPFPTGTWEIGGVNISKPDVGIFAICAATVFVIWLFFRFTKLGLAMRASALNPSASRLLGVRVGWMLAIGWGLAAMLGAIAGMMVAPLAQLEPNMMLVWLIYAFAAAVLGGIESPVGAVVGGLSLGVGINLLSTYIDFVTPEVQLPIALVVLLAILLLKPGGLLGHVHVKRV
jgi:branched-chain amino acid transport system permease protein